MADKDNTAGTAEAEEPEELEMPFPPEVVKRVLGLRKAHMEAEEIENEYKRERIELERKYNEKRAPVYSKRRQIIVGEVEPEFPAPEEGAADLPAESSENPVKGIPGFWLGALANHPVVGEFIQQEDTPALEALEDITIQYDETYNIFTLTFTFGENPYFSNRELTKKYELTDILDEKGPQLISVTGTAIEWKEGKNLCVKEIKKKQKAKAGKNKGQIRQITKQVPTPSFFHYFSEPKSEEEEEEEKEENEEEDQHIQLNEEEDYEIAHAIRTCIIPDAVLWFTGEARDDDDYDEDEEGDEDEDEDDEDEEEEEEEEAPKSKGKGSKGNKGSAPNTAGGGEQPECKQN